MKIPRLLSMIHKEFLQILRDPRTLGLTFAMPLMQLLLLGFAATNDVRNVPLAVIDRDRTTASRQLVDAFRNADYFQIAYDVDSEADLRRLVDDGSARAGLIIPPGYGDLLADGQTSPVSFVLDGSDPSIAGTALANARAIAGAKTTTLQLAAVAALGQDAQSAPSIQMHTQVWYNPDLVSAFYMIPALLGLILQFTLTNLTANAIVRERERGTIEQLIVTPITATEMMIAKLTPFVVIGMIDTVEVLVLGVLIFNIPINGSIPLLLLLTGLFLATILGIGLFVSTVAHTAQQAQLMTLLILLPSQFLSGLIYPLAAMPRILQVISYLFPLRYFLVLARGVVLKGVGVSALWPNILALTTFAVVIMGAAVSRFRKSLD